MAQVLLKFPGTGLRKQDGAFPQHLSSRAISTVYSPPTGGVFLPLSKMASYAAARFPGFNMAPQRGAAEEVNLRNEAKEGGSGVAEVVALTTPPMEYESVLCVKPDVSVYRIPPRASNRGYRASDWKLDQPDWTGRLRITSKGKTAYIKLEDKVSGELFAQAPVEQYPGIAVETVTDSSRYFVIRIQDGTGRSAFIGIGFTDRGDAFDFNVSLQDHFKWVKQETEISKESQEMDSRPKLDLGFKEGQTIKLSIGNITTKKGGASKPRTAGTGGLSLLPPPPGGKVTVPPPSSVAISNHVTPPPIPKSNHGGSDADILLDLDSPASITTPAPASVSASNDLWGDFSTASSSVPNQAPQPSNWVQF
ncbi:Adaptin ear-binding coat-associated protein 1 [Fukomys damarensis]|uniref:Adaptin ear-binding coat-associated protein 1 n=2 Tax=Fukomys damarensis TaxID=885580 RepID=A0A091CVE9_FUKDA|nr:Adaptin ear-binding coat-associated protein 1 [Fukomys damarensis]